MFSFVLIVAVLQFSHTDAACNEGDQVLKVMKLDGSPACRHCHCWGTMKWVCVVKRSACKYINNDQQLALMKYQQSNPKQNHKETRYKLSHTNDNNCDLRDRIIHMFMINGLPACRQCTCWGTVHFACTVEKRECDWPRIQVDLCAKNKLSRQKILLNQKEKCFSCNCKNGNFFCSPVYKGSGNILVEEACQFTTATATTTTTKSPPATLSTTKSTTTTVSANSPFKDAEFIQTGNKKYYLVTWYKVDWHKANEYCHHHNLQFATITSKKENDDLVGYIIKMDYGNEGFWTSGTNLPDGGKFYWKTTGKRFTYTDWGPDEPNNFNHGEENENCLEIVNDYEYHALKWNDARCSLDRYFVCEGR